MARLCRSLVQLCWVFGMLSMLAGVLFRLAPTLIRTTTYDSRGGLILAGVLFLCALATREVERTLSPGG